MPWNYISVCSNSGRWNYSAMRRLIDDYNKLTEHLFTEAIDMGIRDKNYNWTQEAIDLSCTIKEALTPIFDEYKQNFTFEELYYLVCHTFDDIIIDESLGSKFPNYNEEWLTTSAGIEAKTKELLDE